MKNQQLCIKCFLFVIGLGLYCSGNSQQYPVSGKLIDSASSKPVADATINFLQPQNKTSVTILSDKSGRFETTLAAGPYKVTITHSSYRKKGTHLAVQPRPTDMGSIQLVALVKSLSEVTVIATRPLVEQKDGKLIYNVEDDPAAKSESASDLLRKTPYVNVDGDGAIQVNGQSNFKVLLDGRETSLFTANVKEALKAFPGSTIARIEVITSPSAKYDAEGVGGIINIITKKKVAGYNGAVNSNITSIGNRSSGMNISLKKGRLGVTAMYSLMTNPSLPGSQLSVTTPVMPFAFKRREVGGHRETDIFFHQGNLELSYDIDSTNTLVVYGNLSKVRNEAVNQQTILTVFNNGNSQSDPYYLQNKVTVPTYGFGTEFIRKYKGKPQKELSLRFQGIYNTVRNVSNSEQGIGSIDRFVINNSEAMNREYSFQADFVEPLNKTTRIETGLKTVLRKAHSNFDSQVKYDKTSPYQADPGNSDQFAYDQNVYSGYVSLNKNFKKGTTRLGLRVEDTTVDGDFKSTTTTVQQQYTSVIPNLMISNTLSKSINTNFTYNLRLGRPSISSLNPFVNNNDSLFRSYGNPHLGPQYIHAIAFQVRFFKGSKFISVQTGFNFANNLIIQNPAFDATTGITSITSANAGQIREFSLGFVSNLPVGKKWNFGVNATGRLARLRNSLQSDWFNTTAGNVNANITFKASPWFVITSNSGYFVPLRMPNSTFPDNYFYSFNFAYKVFRQKLTMTATFTNFLQEKRKFTYLTENENFVTTNTQKNLFRNVGIALSYTFGRLKENVSKKKGITNDDQVQ